MTGRRQLGLVIFDLDNTLADRDRFFGDWAEGFVRERGLDGQTNLPILREADEDGAAPRTRFFEQVRERLGLESPPSGWVATQPQPAVRPADGGRKKDERRASPPAFVTRRSLRPGVSAAQCRMAPCSGQVFPRPE